jgi:hypothetical protein
MQFFVERALDKSLSDWYEIGATQVTGIGAGRLRGGAP